jgi:hypothetical protein
MRRSKDEQIWTMYMIEKGRDGEEDEKHICKPLGKQITLETINKLKEKLGYQNKDLVFYKTRIPESPVEATLTKIDYQVDVAKMKKIHEEEMVISLVVSREPIPQNPTMPITPLKSKSVSTHDDDAADDDEVEESELDEYKVWLVALHKKKKALGKLWYIPIFVYIYS